MNYNDFFESALSAAYKKAPMTDDDTFMRIVKERAKNMKKNDNVKQMHFTEITPEYAESKKSHKALNVFAGVAGTAAVLTGAVFGLNWLNEHGGLKGPDVQGAGYHENVAITEETALSETEAVIEDTEADITVEASADSKTKNCIEIDAVGKPVNGVVPMDETIELDDMTVHFTGYEFDSQYMRIEYEVKYTGGEQRHTTGAPVRPIEIADTLVGDGMVIVVSHPAYEYAAGIDDTVYCYADVVINGTPDYVRIPFGYAGSPEVPPAERYTEDDELFAITVHYDPDSVIRTFLNDRVKIGETGREFRITDAFITPTHISARLKFDEKPTQELTDNITAGLRLKAGSSIDLTNKKTIGYTKDGELYWLVAWYDEPIALDDIADANINGFCFSESDEEYYEMMRTKHSDIVSIGHSPLYTPADEWFDCDGKSVHVTGYYFDGIILRLRYETYYDHPLSIDTAAEYGYSLPNNLVDGIASLCNGEYDDESRISEGIIAETVNAFVKTPVDTLEIPFGDGIFTVRKNDSVPMIEKDIDKVITVRGDDTIHLDRFVLSSGNLSITMSGSPYTDGYGYKSETGKAYMYELIDAETVITLKNGDLINFNHGWNEPAGMGLPIDQGFKFYQFTDPIDISDVVSITVNGMEIYVADEVPETTE